MTQHLNTTNNVMHACGDELPTSVFCSVIPFNELVDSKCEKLSFSIQTTNGDVFRYPKRGFYFLANDDECFINDWISK